MPERVSEDQIKAKILNTTFYRQGTLTLCVLTLVNGFNVIGESTCVDPKAYDLNMGGEIAYKKAFSKAWELEAYLLAEKRFNEGKH